MARDGYKIFDSDTHVGPYVEIIDKYFTADMRKRLEGWEQYKATRKNTGHITYNKGQRSYGRRLHTAGPEDQALAPIVTEIQFRDAPGPVLMRGEPPRFPDAPSAAFRVMVGGMLSTELDLARLRLTLANEGPLFIVRAEPRAAAPKSWVARLFGG
jgi:hypothetical protein